MSEIASTVEWAITVDHRSCRTGISPIERHRTVHAVLDPQSTPEDFIQSGHLFGVFAKEGGVLRRAGHREATVDLARLAGLQPARLLCEICSREGNALADRSELERIGREGAGILVYLPQEGRGIGLQILEDLGLSRVRLLTDQPKQVDALVHDGVVIEIVDQLPLIAADEPLRRRARALASKGDELGHERPADFDE